MRNPSFNEEREKGLHGERLDETRTICKKCHQKAFIKKGFCRKCRGVCEDCGREDCPKELLKEYGRGTFLCPDCFLCRSY